MTPATAHRETAMLNGTKIYFEIHGEGEPLLLLHGFGGCAQDWIDAAIKHCAGDERNPSAALLAQWGEQFQIIVPDLRGHGRSFPVTDAGRSDATTIFRHDQAATDMMVLLDKLGIERVKGVGISGGANVLLHMATKQPERVTAMVLVSATSYFPAQARTIMCQYAENPPTADLEVMQHRHPGGDAQIAAILASTKSFADSYDDMNFTPPYLATIMGCTLIIQGDRDPLYPVEISVEMARAISRSSLWIIPNAGHGPVAGARWPEFVKAAAEFLRE